MARLAINWKTVTAVAPAAVVTGQSEEESVKAQAALAERPMIVYIVSDDTTDSDVRKLEDVVFANEKMAIGTKFFDCLKISEGNALSDRLLKETGRSAPRIVFLTRAYEETDSLEGRQISAGKLIKAMSNLVRKEYEDSFDKMCRDYTKLLNDLDRLESKRTKLAADRARLQEKPNPSREKKLERDEKELEEEIAEWNQKEKDILSFKSKGDPQTEA